jgi:predicted dehydrogenase
VADAQAIIDICAERKTKLQIAYPVRFSPSIQRLKQTLDEEKLGKLYSAKCTNHGSMPGGWFVEQALSGGGAVIDHTVHVMDLLRWFWDTEVVEVYAEIGESLLHPELGIDDVGLLSFKLANGIYGTLDTSWSRPPSSMIWGDVKIEILGEKGWLQVDAYSQNVTVSSNKVGQTKLQGWGSNADLGLIRDFTTMIREEREPFITGYDGLKSMEVALKAYESARTGQVVSL